MLSLLMSRCKRWFLRRIRRQDLEAISSPCSRVPPFGARHLPMHEAQRLQRLAANEGYQGLGEIYTRSQRVRQRPPGHELEHDAHLSLGDVRFLEGHDVRVPRHGLEPDLVHEIFQLVDWRHLQRPVLLRLPVDALVDFARRPLPKLLDQLVRLFGILALDVHRLGHVAIQGCSRGQPRPRRAGHVKPQSVQHLVWVLDSIVLGDTGRLQNKPPLLRYQPRAGPRRQASPFVPVGRDMGIVLEVERRRNLQRGRIGIGQGSLARREGSRETCSMNLLRPFTVPNSQGKGKD
eukprot:scaffold564_cov248-Pinguiococcus_pyrenoidosus.AAC.18